MNKYFRSLTLIELLIAISLFSTVILSIASISYFSQYHVISAERRVGLQNELSYALAHMSRNVQRAVGYSYAVRKPLELLDDGFKVWVEPATTPTPGTPGDDEAIDYTLSENKLIYRNSSLLGSENLSTHIVAGVVSGVMPSGSVTGGFYIDLTESNTVIEIGLVARYKPDKDSSADNPEVRMKTRLYAHSAAAQ